MKQYTIAVVGALGNVGTEMRSILEGATDLPIAGLVPMDVPDNAGRIVTWREKAHTVVAAAPAAFAGVDIAIFSAGETAAKQLAPEAVKRGAVCIDNSTAFRMDPEHPLVIPEVNPEALGGHRGIIANPNCSTIQMLVALAPLHKAYRVRRVVVSTYQAVSGTGQAAVEELHSQVKAFAANQRPDVKVYPHQIAFNALPHIDAFLDNGYTKEEMKLVNETAKILDPSIKVTATTVRIPVATGHSESINVEFERPYELDELRALLARSPGIVIEDDPARNLYPLAIRAAGQDPVYIGRLRRDFSCANGLNFWCVADNLRKGAALNTVQIARELIARDLVRVP
jgi:aspartate-semialdehyde dehydrogenase